MTETTPAQTTPAQTSSQVSTDIPQQPSSPARRKNGKSPMGWLALLVILILVVAGWLGWQQWQLFTADQQQIKNGQQRVVAQLEQWQQQQTQALAAQQSLIDGLRVQVVSLSDQTLLHGQKIAALHDGGELVWLLNEAKTLASLANQRLLLTADLPSAYQLLQAADKTLAQIDAPDVLPARRALAADMERVKAAQQIDTTALLLRLGALVDDLQYLTLPELTEKTAVVEAQQDETSWWQQLVSRLPLTIQRYEGDLPLPLAASQLAQVRLSLAMDFQQAQLALLQGKPAVYQQGLTQAVQTLDAYFLQDDTRIAHVRASLDELLAIDIQQSLPRTGAGLEAIKARLQAVHASAAKE